MRIPAESEREESIVTMPTPRPRRTTDNNSSPKSFFKEVLQKIGHSQSVSNSPVGDFIDQTMNHLQKTNPEMFLLEIILTALEHSNESNVLKVNPT